MNQDNHLPDLAGDLLRIHRAITRGLTIGFTRGSEFITEGLPDQSLQQGFALYLQALTIVAAAHHMGEDEVAFPALKLKLPGVPYGRLAADHLTIAAEIGLLKNLLPELAGVSPAAALVRVVENLNRILTVWKPHIQIEQTSFSAKALAGVMSPAEQAQVAVALAKHSQELAVPPFLALPFVLFNLAPAVRAEMAAMMPRRVVEELIPGEWKEKWAPMKPFLLD
jgi:hypothetical protein